MKNYNVNDGSRFAMYPLELFGNKELTVHSKTIYVYMANDYLFYKDKKGYYAPSQQVIADATALSVSTVKRSLKQLIQHNLVTIEFERKKCATHYHVNSVKSLTEGVVIVSPITPRELKKVVKEKAPKSNWMPPVTASDTDLVLSDDYNPFSAKIAIGGSPF